MKHPEIVIEYPPEIIGEETKKYPECVVASIYSYKAVRAKRISALGGLALDVCGKNEIMKHDEEANEKINELFRNHVKLVEKTKKFKHDWEFELDKSTGELMVYLSCK